MAATAPPKLPTSAQVDSTLKIEVLPSSDLLDPSRKPTLRNLCRLISDSFSAHGHPKDNGDTTPEALFLGKRLAYDEELPGAMGPEALTAICTDETSPDDSNADASNGATMTQNQSQHQQPRTNKNIVATGSLKLWKGKVVDLARSLQNTVATQTQTQTPHTTNGEITTKPLTEKDLTLAEQTLTNTSAASSSSSATATFSDTWNWEVKLCASSDDPRYRGRGLITGCVEALIAELKRRGGEGTATGHYDARAKLPIKLWITSLKGTGNTEYWVRRGFEKVGEADVAPAGTWGSTRDITVSTLWKIIEWGVAR